MIGDNVRCSCRRQMHV